MLIYTKINHFLLFFLLFFIIRDYLEIITTSRCTIKIMDVNNKVSVIKGKSLQPTLEEDILLRLMEDFI